MRPLSASGALLLVLLTLWHHDAAAATPSLPVGGVVKSGAAQIGQSGGQMNIKQSSQNLALNWQSFDIGAGAGVRFEQPSTASVALNRILGPDASRIFGQLSANGQVFLTNPNGILFGPTAQVNVGGLIASSNTLSDADFQAGRYRFGDTGRRAAVTNRGKLAAADGGYIALLGTEVRNEGSVAARGGEVLLAAGGVITVSLGNGSLIGYNIDRGAARALVDNQRLLNADGGTVTLAAAALPGLLGRAVVNNDGVVEARTIDHQAGVIRLTGDPWGGALKLGGTLDASAPHGGPGGTVATSAANLSIAATARVSTAAADGRTGTWTLAQPGDLRIAAAGGNVAAGALAASLNTTNVTIETGGAWPGRGDIALQGALAWSAPTTLALRAGRDITVDAGLSNNAGASVLLRADDNGLGLGTIRFGARGKLALGGGGRADLYYNPLRYAAPTDFSAVVSGPATAWMLVNNVRQLQAMNTNLAGDYALGRDIDAGATRSWNGGAGFAPVGSGVVAAYTGQFDGLNHSISNLWIRRPDTDLVGLFGSANNRLVNLRLAGGDITGRDVVGALVGLNRAQVGNVHSSANVSGVGQVGGLIGEHGGTLSDASSAGNVSATDAASGRMTGGLVGRLMGGSIAASHSSARVSGYNAVGGLVGYIDRGAVSDAWSGGAVSGTYNVGGLVGVAADGYIELHHVHSTATVNGTSAVGGLVGQYTYGTIHDAYFSGNVSSTGAGAVGGLVGYNGQGRLDRTYSLGNVAGLGADGVAGGLVGYSGGAITNSYSKANVSGRTAASGGLVGDNDGSVATSYSSGKVGAGPGSGGLVGRGDAAGVVDSYWDVSGSGLRVSAGGKGLQSAQMTRKASFTGFDFSTIWRIDEGRGTPQLR
jgi:filamentous hemagglutinin family protein